MSLVSGLLNQEITTVSSITNDQYGDVTTTTLYSGVVCRWQEKIQRITDTNNEEIVSTVEVWLLPNYTDIKEKYRIIFDSETYIVAGTEDKYDLGGKVDHIKLYLV